jgi:hypothetical protein
MENPETQAIYDTQDSEQKNTKQNKTNNGKQKQKTTQTTPKHRE